jgi:uncharacterized membrane protein YcaP (DUF421 family)
MGRQRLSLNDLTVAARLQGIRRIQDVELAVLEADGRLSFFTRTADDSEDGSPDTQIAG